MKVILIPSFEKKLKTKKYKLHIKTIHRLIKKLRRLGKNAVKILDVEDYYLLAEMKVKRPPYRLYIIINQRSDTYYVVEWTHKEQQEKIINELKYKLSLAVKFGLDQLFS